MEMTLGRFLHQMGGHTGMGCGYLVPACGGDENPTMFTSPCGMWKEWLLYMWNVRTGDHVWVDLKGREFRLPEDVFKSGQVTSGGFVNE
jgi:hypothetical protein